MRQLSRFTCEGEVACESEISEQPNKHSFTHQVPAHMTHSVRHFPRLAKRREATSIHTTELLWTEKLEKRVDSGGYYAE